MYSSNYTFCCIHYWILDNCKIIIHWAIISFEYIFFSNAVTCIDCKHGVVGKYDNGHNLHSRWILHDWQQQTFLPIIISQFWLVTSSNWRVKVVQDDCIVFVKCKFNFQSSRLLKTRRSIKSQAIHRFGIVTYSHSKFIAIFDSALSKRGQ